VGLGVGTGCGEESWDCLSTLTPLAPGTVLKEKLMGIEEELCELGGENEVRKFGVSRAQLST
jgi:hypothetical protein